MDNEGSLDELLICRLDRAEKKAQPTTIVIFGASGDLTVRKLIPAFHNLFLEKQLPDPFRIIGVARRDKSSESWRQEMKEGVEKFSRTQPLDPAAWDRFAENIHYCRGDFTEAASFQGLADLVNRSEHEGLKQNLLFYLAISPGQFAPVVEQLHNAGLLSRDKSDQHKLVVEKPFGHDLNSARSLNLELTRFAHEQQIYRIDHYLGKETVQNIMMFRFSNAIFEQLWNRTSVDHVQITVSEKLSVGGRGGYYEHAGALRDMVQNHLLQVLAMIAMEPPVSLDAEAIRDEKVKLLRAVRIPTSASVPRNIKRGQYITGEVDGASRPAYRDEPKVKPESNVETFVAMRLMIDNWRWSNVPFYLRTGKNLPLSASEVRIQFRHTPSVLFAAQCGPRLDANAITLRLQPDEGIFLRFNGKVPGNDLKIRPVRMHFGYDSAFGAYTPEAYERLLLEALSGDATLFIRRDEVEAAWSIMDPIRQAWDGVPLQSDEFYPAGSWGPTAADELLSANGHAWRNPKNLIESK